MAGKNNDKKLKYPVTVRQAQKLMKDPNLVIVDQWGDEDNIASMIRNSLSLSFLSSVELIKKELAKRACKGGHNHILINNLYDYEEDYEDYEDFDFDEADTLDEAEFSPKGTDEVKPQSENPSDDAEMHGGDNASQEVEDGQSEGGEKSSNNNLAESQGTGTDEGSQGKGCGDNTQVERDSSESDVCSETGSSTSESSESDENSQSTNSQKAGTSGYPSSELDEDTATTSMSDIESQTMQGLDDQNLREGEGLAYQNQSDLNESQGKDNFNPDGQVQSFDDAYNQGQSDNSEDNQEKSLSEDDADWGNSNSDEKVSDDIPQHQKKWGKKFSKAETENAKLSSSANDNHGGINSSLEKVGISPKLSKECQRKLSKLISDASSETSPRRDYQDFCVRLKTFRNPNPARKEESGRPVILIMADVSGSCAGFSDQSVLVAKAASKLGVIGSDVIVLTHSNGHPCELEHNGKPVNIDGLIDNKKSDKNNTRRRKRWNSGSEGFYDNLIRKYNITVAIALGDWDASHYYYQIAVNPNCEKFIWLDNAHCSSRGFVKDETKLALESFENSDLKINFIHHKLIYKTGCKDAKSFIQEI